MKAVNYFNEAHHLGCCSSPRSASDFNWVIMDFFTKICYDDIPHQIWKYGEISRYPLQDKFIFRHRIQRNVNKNRNFKSNESSICKNSYNLKQTVMNIRLVWLLDVRYGLMRKRNPRIINQIRVLVFQLEYEINTSSEILWNSVYFESSSEKTG